MRFILQTSTFQYGTIGLVLDGTSTRNDEACITELLLNPSDRLAKGFEKLGVSPMPPMSLIWKSLR